LNDQLPGFKLKRFTALARRAAVRIPLLLCGLIIAALVCLMLSQYAYTKEVTPAGGAAEQIPAVEADCYASKIAAAANFPGAQTVANLVYSLEQSTESNRTDPHPQAVAGEQTPDPLSPLPLLSPTRLLLPPGSAGYYSDQLNDFTAGVEITDADGDPVTGNYSVGDTYNFTIIFKEDWDKQFWAACDDASDPPAYYMTYQLPPEIKVVGATEGVMYADDSDNVVLGTYKIDKSSGMVTFYFNNIENDAEPGEPPHWVPTDPQAEPPVYYFTNNNFSVMVLQLSGTFTKEGRPSLIDWGGVESQMELEIAPPQSPSLSVEKSVYFWAPSEYASDGLNDPAGYNPDTKQTSYTIAITANGGDATGITLNDQLEAAAVGGDYASFSNRPVPGSLRVTVLDDSKTFAGRWGSPTPLVAGRDYVYTYDESTGRFGIGFGDYVLPAGYTIKVEYFADLAPVVEALAANQYGYAIDTRNTVAVMDKDLEQPIESQADLALNRRFMGKESTPAAALDGTAAWSGWYVGDGKTPLNGAVLTDTLTAGMVFPTQTVTVNFKNRAGHVVYAMPFDLPQEGRANQFTITVPGPELYGEICGVTIGALDAQGQQTGPSYITKIADMENYTSGSYGNQITVDFGNPNLDNPPPYNKDVTIGYPRPDGIGVAKDGRYVTADGQNYGQDAIEFTVTAQIPKSLAGRPVWLVDPTVVYGWLDGRQTAMTISYAPEVISLKAYGANGAMLVDFTDPKNYTLVNRLGNFSLYLGNNSAMAADQGGNYYPKDSLWPISTENATLVFVYRAPLDAPVLVNGAPVLVNGVGMTLREALTTNDGKPANITRYPSKGRVTNVAQLKYLNFDQHVDSLSVIKNIYGPITKCAEVTGKWIHYLVAVQPGWFLSGNDFIDEWDASLRYVPNSFSISCPANGSWAYGPYAADGNGSIVDLTPGYIHGNKLTLPNNVMMNLPAVVRSGNLVTGMRPFQPVLREQTGTDDPAKAVFLISYWLQFNDDGAPRAYRNEARFGGFSAGTTVTAGTPVIDKSMTYGGNVASVSLDVNPGGKRLAGSANYITVTDQMSDTLAIFPDTIEVWLMDGAGNQIQKIDFSNPPSPGPWSCAIGDDQHIAFTFPDQTPIKVYYKALIVGRVNTTVTVKNEARIQGVDYASVTDSFSIDSYNTSGFAASGRVTVLKRDAETQAPLAGATFALYVWLPDGRTPADYDPVQTPAGIDPTYTVGGMTLYYAGTAISDGGGNAVIRSGWLNPSANAVYALVEVRQPDGYQMPAGADRVRLFSYGTQPPEARELTGGREIELKPTGLFTVANTKQHNDFFGPQLPETGGPGAVKYTGWGLGLIFLSGILTYKWREKRGQ